MTPQADGHHALHTGCPGLDTVLSGGFTPERLYLVEGVPGSGKTTLALQFLLEGARRGESTLYVGLAETEIELQEVARSQGWSLDGIDVFHLAAPGEGAEPDAQYTLFHPSEVELGETVQRLLERVDQARPVRMVFDSLAELRLLAGTPLRFRRQVLALKHHLVQRGCTVMMLDDCTHGERGQHVHTIAHGVIQLDQLHPEYGGDRRRLRVTKFRGRRFIGGYHDYDITTGGLHVHPRLVAAEHRQPQDVTTCTTGLAPLDALLGGGLDTGTSTLLLGAAGTGKSTLATQVVVAAAERGQKAVMFIFDEGVDALLRRSDGIGLPLRAHVEAGTVRVVPVDPAELSPGAFVSQIREQVERDDVRVVVIDSLNGYFNSMPEERFMVVHMHELLAYLALRGVTALLISPQHGLIGQMDSVFDVSYLADCVMLLRYFEVHAEVRQAISVLKKRTGRHERTIRPMHFDADGIHIGEPLRAFHGVLTGVPQLQATGEGGHAP